MSCSDIRMFADTGGMERRDYIVIPSQFILKVREGLRKGGCLEEICRGTQFNPSDVRYAMWLEKEIKKEENERWISEFLEY